MATDLKIEIPGQVTGQALSFMQRLLGPFAEAADFLSDRIRFYRWQAASEVISQASAIAEAHGITPREIPLKFLVPFLEKCSLEEANSELLQMWANLLANASAKYDDRLKLYSSILSEISHTDATILDELHKSTSTGRDFSIEMLSGNTAASKATTTKISTTLRDTITDIIDSIRQSGGIYCYDDVEPTWNNYCTNSGDILCHKIEDELRRDGCILLTHKLQLSDGHQRGEVINKISESSLPLSANFTLLERQQLITSCQLFFSSSTNEYSFDIYYSARCIRLSALGHHFVECCRGIPSA